MNKQSQYPRTGLLGWLCVLKWEGMREVDRANERRVNLFAMGWALSLIAVSALITFLDLPALVDVGLAFVPAIFGLLTLRAYLRMLRQADEMLRQIHLEGMAVGFGTGMIIGMICVVLPMPPEWIGPAIVVPMCLAFTARVILAAREVARDTSMEDGEIG